MGEGLKRALKAARRTRKKQKPTTKEDHKRGIDNSVKSRTKAALSSSSSSPAPS